ncbi:MAG: endonuclease/exonuclease/phosphatase family protein [Lacipirellulaceae bacterium]
MLAVVLWAVAASVQAQDQPHASRVMSFNIRFDEAEGYLSPKENSWISLSGKHRRDLVLQMVSDFDPDILCLQEPLMNQVQDIRRMLTKHGFYGVGRDDGKQTGEYCAILFRRSRFEPVDQGTFWLNEQADQPGSRYPKTCCARIASWIILNDLLAEGRELVVLNTHWDHQIQDSRLFSAVLIRKRLPELAGDRPILVMGDLNVPPENPAFTQLVTPTQENPLRLIDSYRSVYPLPEPIDEVRDQFRLRAEEGTFNNFKGWTYGNRIDFILHSKHFRTLEAGIVRFNKEGRYPSDHFPVTATLQLLTD